MRSALVFIICAATACYTGLDRDGASPLPGADDGGYDGAADGGDTGAETGGDPGEAEVPTLATHAGLRRLTVGEYDNALRDLLGDDARPGAEFLPEDALTPFDNDYMLQAPSEAFVLAAEKLATEAADRLLADPARLDALLGCTPTGADDAACLREFVTAIGRRAFRRPLRPDEIDGFATLLELGVEADDFRVAAAAVVRAMLQDPNFLYRVEIGEPIEDAPEIVALDDWEVATRLSFFLWGTIPDDELLDLAQAEGLSTADDVRAQAEAMLADPRARESVDRFHALWLGYARFGGAGLGADMRVESSALVERVVFETQEPWLSLLTSTQTFVTPALAEHYGLPEPATAGGWVDYGESGRGGILSHGTVLALGAKFDDTSPTIRGLQLRERLFCQTIEVPEDLDVNTDDPPGVDPNDCKWERYAAHREVGACAGCHLLLDGVGFGLENYDASGAFRTTDPGKPECTIAGDGELAGVGTFNGPGELGRLLAEQSAVRDCAVRQLHRFVTGRSEPDELDEAFLDALDEEREQEGEELDLRTLMVDMAASEAFRFRVLEEGV
jgi:hypothetical protein